MEDVIEKIAELTVNSIDYILKLNASQDEIAIQLEQKQTGEIWNNLFSKDYIEDSTQKAGNYKKFNTFLKMLISSINKSSESVSLNILSYQDLEAMKQRKINNNNNNNKPLNNNSSLLSKKKFLILQYQGEYDKVSYPLSLDLNENPDQMTLKQIISRLRLENEVLRSNRSDQTDSNLIISLKHENQILRSKLFNKNNDDNNSNNLLAQRERDNDHLQNLKLIEEQGEEIKYIKQILENREREVLILKSENAKLLEHASNFEEMHETIGKIKEGERVMFQQQTRLEQMELEMSSILQELETYKNNDKRQRQRILTLEQELESTLNKVTTTYPSTQRSRNTSKNNHNTSQSQLSSSINRGRSTSMNKKISTHNGITASPLRNSSALLNTSGRQTPTNLSRSNSQSNLKKTPSRPTSSNQRLGGGGGGAINSLNNRRNSIESDTASSNQRKNSNNNLRTSSPIRSSYNFNSSITKKTSNTPSKKTIVSNTKISKSPSGSTKNSINYGNNNGLYPSKNNNNKNNTTSSLTNNNKTTKLTKTNTLTSQLNKFNQNDSSDDESRLMKKLDELRKQNKENTESQNALKKSKLLEKSLTATGGINNNNISNSVSSSQLLMSGMNTKNINNNNNTFVSTMTKESSIPYTQSSPYNTTTNNYNQSQQNIDDTTDIEDRLHKLQDLLRIAKN